MISIAFSFRRGGHSFIHTDCSDRATLRPKNTREFTREIVKLFYFLFVLFHLMTGPRKVTKIILKHLIPPPLCRLNKCFTEILTQFLYSEPSK